MKTKRKRISSGWQSYFDFSAREKRGITVLSFILIFQILLLIYLGQLTTPFDPPNLKLYESLIRTKDILPIPSSASPDSFFRFNPNILTAHEWSLLGLSDKQSSSVVHYIERGGKFRIKSDVKKIYGLTNEKFEKLKPYILLPDSSERKTNFNQHERKSKTLLIEINTSDSIEWDKLYGIGAVLASRIIRYRERLGGFSAIEQIREVWGIQDSVFEKIKGHLKIEEPTLLRKIHLNTDSFAVIANHPYLNRKAARLIINYREQHPFRNINELTALPLLTEENFRKLAPYLTTE